VYDYCGSLIRELYGLFLYVRDLRFCTWWVCHAMGCHFLHYRNILLVWIHGVIRKEDCNFYLNIGVQIIKKSMVSFIVIGLIQLTYTYLVGVLLLPPLLILLLQLPSHQVLLLKLLLLRSSYSFFGAFAKLWKATISFVMSVCPHGTTRLPVDEFWWNFIFQLFLKSVGKIQVLLKSDKNNG
jgi:hypothetical protein